MRENLTLLPVGHEYFVRIALPANLLLAGVLDSKKNFTPFVPSRFKPKIKIESIPQQKKIQ